MFQIRVNNDKCTGCRACEIACSYHHRKVFNPKISSIEIRKLGKEENVSIKIYQDLPKKIDGHLLCNHCIGESEPLCAKYCTTGAIQVVSTTKGEY